MRLTYKCSNCNKSYYLSCTANDRGELSKIKNLSEECTHCNFENKIEINRVKAVISPYNNFAYGIAFLMSIIIGVTFILVGNFEVETSNINWQFYAIALIFVIPFLIAKVSIENDLKAVKIFNSYYV